MLVRRQIAHHEMQNRKWGRKMKMKRFVQRMILSIVLVMLSVAVAPVSQRVYATGENPAAEDGQLPETEAWSDGQTITDESDAAEEEPESSGGGNDDGGTGGENTKPQEPQTGYYLSGSSLVDRATGKAFTGTGFIPVDDEYYYVVRGVWNRNLQDIVKVTNVSGSNGEWWYVRNGKADFGANTVAKNSNGWWKVTNGRVDFNYNGIAKNNNGWWRCLGGKVDFGFTGFAENENGWWYCENGKVKFNKTTVMKGRVDGRNGWWYVRRSQVMFTDTVAKNENGWWYIDNGRVNFSYDGFGQNRNGWWYCQDGKVSFRVNSVVKGTVNGSSGWWYVRGSKVSFSNTVAKNSKGWWRIENGKVNFNCNSVEKNSKGWWRIENGKVNFNFNGLARNRNGWWYCKGGKVQFGATTVVKGRVDGTNAWWYVSRGKVNKNYNGLGTNDNGTWLIEDGKVNFSFSGKKTIDGVSYTFIDGRCTSNYRGWQKLGGKYYYFDRNTGAQVRGRTVDGIRLNSDGSAVSSTYNNEKIRTMIKARSIMESVTNTSDSRETKLRKCFNWVMRQPYKRYRTLKVARQKAGWEMLFANDHFERGNGCCVSDACAFAFLAHECGYETVYICDDTSHSWVEINGRAYDPLFAESKSFSRNYGVTYGVYGLHPANKTKI